MSEKRFKEIVSVETIIDEVTGDEYKHCLVTDEFIDLLNRLSDEIEELKQENKRLRIKMNTYHEANKTLHQTLKRKMG